ncbi:universal stress protein [Verrucomicrobiaceae bacterium 227]
MTRFKNILVATDTRLSDQRIVEAAVEVAKQRGATLTIVDVVQNFSWAQSLAVQDIESVRDSFRKLAFDRLVTISDLVGDGSIDLKIKLLEGKTSESLINEVTGGGYDLLIAVGKGKKSSSKDVLGRTAKILLRDCPCEIWLSPHGGRPVFTRNLSRVPEEAASMIA